MLKNELIRKIEQRIQDMNYQINYSQDFSNFEKEIFAWKHSRIELENVLKLVKKLND